MKLEGIRVIDLSVFLPGPYLTLAMADHGAEVIKIEAPGEGDPGRHIGLSDGPSTVFFRNLNRGKNSVVLDLKDHAQREALLALCETADVFVESFRPGTVDRLGVGYQAVRARNPRIVYCSISAFGQDGALRGRPAHDLALEAESGLLSMTLGSDGKPAMPGIPAADVLAGLQGLSGVLMALLRRERTGEGDHIDISMHEVMVGGLLNILGPAFAEDRQPIPSHERTTGGAAFYHPYETADGRYLVLAGPGTEVHPQSARRLWPAGSGRAVPARAWSAPEAGDRLPGRRVSQEDAGRLGHPSRDARRLLRLRQHPARGVRPSNLLARGMIHRDELNRRHVGAPIRFSHEPARPNWREPSLCEHTTSYIKTAALPE